MFVVKECTKCKEYKLLEEYYKLNIGAFGKTSQCKKCKNIDNRLRTKQWRSTDKFKEYNRQRDKRKRDTDPMYRVRCNISRNIRLNINAKGSSKSKRTHEILGCDYEYFKLHIESQFTKGMNWDNYGQWHLDHIYPVSLAKDEQHLIELNHYTNLQPLWAKDNLSKGNKIEPHQIKIPL